MDLLDPETEELLKEILNNDKDFPAILRLKLENCSWEESQKIRSQIKLLRENGYISKLTWGDNLPLLGRIEQKGRSYFTLKEQEETKDFNAWEKLLYKLHKNVHTAGGIPAINIIKLTNDERITISKLQNLGYITNLRAIGFDSMGCDLTYDGLHYFENRNSMATQQYNGTEQKERIFISHSSKDEVFVVKLAQLFELLGVNRNNIFCSSIEGQGVKHGKKIEEAVRNEIIEDKVLIYVISNNFLNSNYCLNELGAGWILSDKRTQNKNLFHIKLPDISFDDIKGFIGGSDKCTECNDKSITAFVEEFEEVLGLPLKKATAYRNLVDNFIKDTQSFIDAAEQASKLNKEEQQKRHLEQLKNRLRNINEAERKIIKAIYTSSSGDYILDPTSATIAALEGKEIIFTANGYYDYLDPQCSYTFQPWVYRVLKEDSKLLKEILA